MSLIMIYVSLFLICPALERPEGVSQQDYVAMEEFQQRTNAVSLEKVKAYYRKLRYAEEKNQTAMTPSSGDTNSNRREKRPK